MSKRKIEELVQVINALGQPEQKRAFISALERGDADEAFRIYDRTVTKLENLPNMILAKILFLTSVKDLSLLSKVNKRFEEVIDDYELIRRRINSRNKLYAFGSGRYGNLGDGRIDEHNVGTPTLIDIGNYQYVKQVSVGFIHTCVVTEDGQLYTFGSGFNGRLGDGRTDYHVVGVPTLINVGNGKKVKQVSAGNNYTCVVTEDGQLYTFGNGVWGALGDGRTDGHNVATPTLISIGNGQRVKQVSAGDRHTCVVTEDGQLYTFGDGSNGILGDGRTDEHEVGTPTLIDVGNGQVIKHVSTASSHTGVVTEDGKLYMFGNGAWGGLGDGRTDVHEVGTPTLIDVGNGQRVKQVSVGLLYTCVVTEDGQLYTFGWGLSGKLGDGRTDNHSVGTPILIDVGNGKVVKQVSAGNSHTCVVTEDGQLYTFGSGITGILGNGRTDDHNVGTPTLIDIGNGQVIKQVSAGARHTCVVTEGIDYNDLTVYKMRIASKIEDCSYCNVTITDQHCIDCNMNLCIECFEQLH